MTPYDHAVLDERIARLEKNVANQVGMLVMWGALGLAAWSGKGIFAWGAAIVAGVFWHSMFIRPAEKAWTSAAERLEKICNGG